MRRGETLSCSEPRKAKRTTELAVEIRQPTRAAAPTRASQFKLREIVLSTVQTKQVTYGPIANWTGATRFLSLSTSNPDAYIEWYQGAAGDDGSLVAAGYGMTSVQVNIPVGTTTYWARLRAPDPGYGDPNAGCDCYSDSNGVTVTQ